MGKGKDKDSDTDIQSWCEVPSIAHFCSLFRQAFDLLEFDIQELEESLLLMNTEDDTSQLVLRLLIRLLKGCSKTFTNNINEDNYNTYLRRLFLSKREEAEEDKFENNISFECQALLDDDIDFPDLSLRNRVRILQQLTEYRLDAEDVFDKVKNLEPNSLRVDSLGTDSNHVTYWYFYGTRLYKEEAKADGKKSKKDKDRKKKKKDKKKKKKKKSRRESTTTEDDDEEANKPKWSVACLTLQDWQDLATKYKKSKKKCDRELYETINDNFLPEIVKMFAEKEREERRKLMSLAPKRASSRIERKRREQELKDRLLAEKLEEERRLEEEYDEKVLQERMRREDEERELARGERARQREAMKEERAKRAAERQVEREFLDPRENKDKSRRQDYEEEEDLYNPFTGAADHDSDEDYTPSREEVVDASVSAQKDARENKEKSSSMHFTNALLRVGSKSTKDVILDKPVRKSPGLLLESAGQSLLQRRSISTHKNGHERSSDAKFNSLFDKKSESSKPSGSLSFGLCSGKISFGLYGGTLAVDHGSGAKKEETSADEEPKSQNGSSSESLSSPVTQNPPQSGGATKKVFSNWGGEFFKKNLDYRANTNKILEKMNLTSAASSSSSLPAVNGDGFRSMFSSTSPTKRSFDVMSKLSSPTSSSSSGESAKKKLKSGSFFMNSP